MKYTNKKCKHSMCLMSKIGLDYHCNKCGGVVVNMGDEDFKTNDYQEELRAELDAEMRLENEGVKI